MKILITGANGFIGRSLCSYLSSRGHTVFPIVRRACDLQSHIVLKNEDEAGWIEILSRCDVVIHLAGRAHINKDKEADSLSAFRAVNVDMTLELAKRSIKAGIKRFIFLSTVKVFGEFSLPGAPFSPDDIPTPKDAYGISKYEAEKALQAVSVKTGLEIVIIRPPLVYGPNVKGNMFSLIKLIKSGVPLPLGSIENKRSLVSIENLSNLIFFCLDHPNAARQIFVVSDGIDLSTAEIAKKIAFENGLELNLFNIPESVLRFFALIVGRKNSIQKILGSLQVDIEKTKRILGWLPIV